MAIHSATATQLDVTWEAPPLDSQNGDIQGYKVWVMRQRNGVQRDKGVGEGLGESQAISDHSPVCALRLHCTPGPWLSAQLTEVNTVVL